MRLTGIERLDDCFDGSVTYMCRFDRPWTRQTIAMLGAFGALEYFKDFPRPFFRVNGAGGLRLKGVEGSSHCRLVVPAGGTDGFTRALEQLLAPFDDR